MHNTLVNIQGRLEKIITQLQAKVPNDEPFGIAHNNWSFPGLTRAELIEEAQSIIDLIKEQGVDTIESGETRLSDYIRRLDFLFNQTIPNMWGNPNLGVTSYMLTLSGLREALTPALANDKQTETAAKLRKLLGQVRGMEARVKELDPRMGTLTTMLERIELAYEAADQLPADLESLSEAQKTITHLIGEATKDQARILNIREATDKLGETLNKNAADAKAVLERCETAYSAATSVGLAAAFSERSHTLALSMWFWVIGLISALSLGSYFGSKQLQSLSELFKIPDASSSVVALNLGLSFLSVGAPVWFAWLATKQISQRFKLAEDYAFKASVSRAYEGYRREAARVDKDMEAQLLASALSRLDELPLRLVEADNHGSPWHELISSEPVKRAMRMVPGFAGKVQDLARSSIVTLASVKPKALANSEEMPNG